MTARDWHLLSSAAILLVCALLAFQVADPLHVTTPSNVTETQERAQERAIDGLRRRLSMYRWKIENLRTYRRHMRKKMCLDPRGVTILPDTPPQTPNPPAEEYQFMLLGYHDV